MKKITEKPDLLMINGKTVCVLTYFNNNNILDIQKAHESVFKHFNLTINTYFDENMKAYEFMDYWMKNIESDIFIFFELDCVPLDNKIYPGIVCEPDVIEEIANFVFNEFNLIFKELTGDEGVYKVVWSIGKMDEVEEIIKQSTRVSKTPTLHHLNPYPVIVKVGRFIDKAESGIFKV
jgi:hypothetical protein